MSPNENTPVAVGQTGLDGVAGSASAMVRINSTAYAMAQDGRTLRREEKHGWIWVLRDAAGNELDRDRYRADLAQRNGLTLLEPNTQLRDGASRSL